MAATGIDQFVVCQVLIAGDDDFWTVLYDKVQIGSLTEILNEL